MKIVQVIENFFPNSIGGTETYVLNVAKNFISEGHEVHVVAPSVSGAKKYNYDGINVHRYQLNFNASKQHFKGLVPPPNLNAFIDILNIIKPDIIHFNTLNRIVNTWNLKAAKNLGSKVFLTPHISSIFCATSTLVDGEGKICDGVVYKHDCVSCYNKKFKRKRLTTFALKALSELSNVSFLLNLLPPTSLVKYTRTTELKTIAECTDGVIALSPWIKRTLAANGVKNIYLVPQGISSIITPDKPQTNNNELLKLIYVGRIFPIKSLETLCDALDQMDENRFKLTIVAICGEDEYAQKIKRRFLSYKNLDWYENVSQTDLGKHLSNQDFLVLPSISEMSPLVILEAFACGIPVIASDIPPMSDNIFDGKNGRLFPIRDSEKLAKILEEYIHNPDLKLNLKNGIIKPPTFVEVSKNLLEIYSKQPSNE